MKTICQTIVVEGRHDTENLKKYYNCVTIETGGTSLPDEVIEEIKIAQQKTGVIILTDPDAPGNMIRHRINQAVPGCLNAYVNKKDARTSKKVGVEHAGMDALEDALVHLVSSEYHEGNKLSAVDLMELGLSGGENSAVLRQILGEKLHVGYGTAKTMLRRLNHLGISAEEIRKVLEDE